MWLEPFQEILDWKEAEVKANEFETLKAAEIRTMCDDMPGKLGTLSAQGQY
jgi:hypothetical protein